MSVPGAIAHPLRKRIIDILATSPKSVSEIVSLTGKNQPTVSSHLAILMKAGVADSYSLGRERVYRLVPEEFENLVNWLDGIMHARDEKHGERENRKSRQVVELHNARTCYDHLAGVEGVKMLDELMDRRWLVQDGNLDNMLRLSPEGEAGLAALGIGVPMRRNSRRKFAYLCMDWTVRRYHLGGALGFSLLKGLENSGILSRVDGSRKVVMNGSLADFLEGVPAGNSEKLP